VSNVLTGTVPPVNSTERRKSGVLQSEAVDQGRLIKRKASAQAVVRIVEKLDVLKKLEILGRILGSVNTKFGAHNAD
jgi:hypothetical protein